MCPERFLLRGAGSCDHPADCEIAIHPTVFCETNGLLRGLTSRPTASLLIGRRCLVRGNKKIARD